MENSILNDLIIDPGYILILMMDHDCHTFCVAGQEFF